MKKKKHTINPVWKRYIEEKHMNLEQRLERAKEQVEAWGARFQEHNILAQNHGSEASAAREQLNHWNARLVELEDILKFHKAEASPEAPVSEPSAPPAPKVEPDPAPIVS